MNIHIRETTSQLKSVKSAFDPTQGTAHIDYKIVN
jgi:hypothetical protein